MIVKFDRLNRFEVPSFTLCNPGSVYSNGVLSKVVGTLVDCEAEEIVFNFNATSELNFRINKIRRDDSEDNAYVTSIYRAVQNRRLIFVDNIGYFMITGIEDGYENGVHYKDVSAKSIDTEIAQKTVPYIENGTYRFSTDETGTNKGIFEMIAEVLPLWTIEHVDKTVAERWRTFEDVDVSLNCLAFMLQNMQDAFECIFIFNNITRTISVYDQENYVRQTNIHITKEDLINTLDITENADDLYTAINVVGDENITISAINPLGGSVIYDFSYYYDWMSDDLGAKVRAWQEAVNAERESYYTLNLQYYKKLSELANLRMEMEKLDTQIAMYIRCRENIVAESSNVLVGSYNEIIVENGGTAITIHEEIADTILEIDSLIAQCENKRDNIITKMAETDTALATHREEITAVHDRLSVLSFFTEDEYAELNHYIFEGSYHDDYVVITDIMTYEERFDQMKTLYDRAKSRLDRVSRPTQEFSVNVENFVFIKDFADWSEQLETGCLINVELDVNNIAPLFLSSITINYDDHSLSMTFGNRFNKFDPKSLYEDVLGQINKSANTLNYIKEVLYPIKNGEFNSMKAALQTSRDLTMNQALASKNEEVIIDGSGYTGRRLLDDGTYDPRQVKLTGKNLVFTDDAWDSCKVALGEILFGDNGSAYGISTEAIIGDVILGNNLRILDNNGSDLLTVVDGKIEASVSDVRGDVETLTEAVMGEDGLAVRITTLENTGVSEVTTTTGYTFNAYGLTIYRPGENIKNLLNNEGMYVSRVIGDTTEFILTADDDGVDAINLTARRFLIVGNNSRFENYDNGIESNRTACFFIG